MIDTLAALFMEPMNGLESYWMLLILPIAAAIAVVYKALKLADLNKLVYESARLTLVIVAFMAAAAAVLYAVVEIYTR